MPWLPRLGAIQNVFRPDWLARDWFDSRAKGMTVIDQAAWHWPKPDDVQHIENTPGVMGSELQPCLWNAKKIRCLMQEAPPSGMASGGIHDVTEC